MYKQNKNKISVCTSPNNPKKKKNLHLKAELSLIV